MNEFSWAVKGVKDLHQTSEGHSYFLQVFVNGILISLSPHSILSMCHAGPGCIEVNISHMPLWRKWDLFRMCDEETSLPFCSSVWMGRQVKRSRRFLSSCQQEESKHHLWLRQQHSTRERTMHPPPINVAPLARFASYFFFILCIKIK